MITRFIAAALAFTMAFGVSLESDKEKRMIAEAEYDYDYKGNGRVIAVIDSGFSLSHESFVLTTDGRLTKDDIGNAALSVYSEYDEKGEKVEKAAKPDCYISEKIPFAYNYADDSTDLSGFETHGTAVISAAAGNNSTDKTHASGAAPEAQILAMKVFSDDGGLSEASVINAIDDAITLGADIICIAFGDECGSSDGFSDFSINSALERAREAGIIIVSSAGEVRQRGLESPYGKDAAIIAQTTDQPFVGTISYPAASEYSFAVGSAETNIYSADCFYLGKEKIPYSDTNNMWTLPTGGKTFAGFFDGKKLEYEFVGGTGEKKDFEKLDLTGKLAVISRGELTFADKCKNAAEKGAIGVIIVDTQPDQRAALSVRMDISESPIPAVMISSSSGSLLKKAKDHSITIRNGEKYYSVTGETPTPSTYSSCGTTPELLLKPDISVIGESIECASAESDDEYLTMGGTAIAAARVAGMLACVKEKLISDGYSEDDAASRAEKLLASSAVIMKRSDGIPYSPRKQGSGAAMLGNALSAGLLVTTEGKSSASLGELSKRWFTLNVTVENLTDSSKNCEISALVGSDGYDEFTYSEIETAEEGEKTLAELFGKESNDRICFIDRFTPFEKATIFPGDENVELNSANGGAYDFRLGARESMTFELTFMIDEETFLKYNDIFENGFFVEGFVSVRSGDEEASLPFAGFLGDASDAPTVDAMIGSTAVYDNTYFWRDYSSDTFGRITLGRDPFSGEESRMFISTSADPTTASVKLHLGLLRSISDVRIKVTKDGETVSEREIGYLPATYLDYTTNMLISPEITIWNCRADDNYYYIYPDGEYEISISYKKLKGGREETLNFSLTLDSTPPEVVAHEFTDDGKLKLEVYDESGISAITICDEYGSVAERDEKGCYDISAFSKYVYVELYDEAMNFRAVRYLKPITENE